MSPSDFRAAFLARAEREGLRFSAEARRGSAAAGPFQRGARTGWAAALAASLVAGALWMSGGGPPEVIAVPAPPATDEVALRLQTLAEQNDLFGARITEMTASMLQGRLSVEEMRAANERLERELARLSADLEAVRSRSAALESGAVEAARRTSTLETALAAERALTGQLRLQLADSRSLADHRRERLAQLDREARRLTQELRTHQELLAADRDVRELMGARNLHIIDVFDVDGRGTRQAAFGRVFYTQGKSLIFYAFDLGGASMRRASHTYQAWGIRQASQRATTSLGIFYADDEKQRRWVLKFEDPEVLKKIDAVFVTAEPPGGRLRPTGEKLLYAYLLGKPNHP